MITIGTCHFKSKTDAIKYYGKIEANEKISSGAIKIGEPKIGFRQKLSINSEGRYFILDLGPNPAPTNKNTPYVRAKIEELKSRYQKKFV